MAFQYINTESGDILDILDQHDNFTIKNHFIVNYSLTDCKRVETVTIDMNASYVIVIRELFPNAKITIDRFHLVQLINRSMNKCRIQIMNQLKTSIGDEDFEALSSCLTRPVPSAISNYMRTSLKTLRKHLPFIENSFIYPYNNGRRMEGNNNKIKVLNRVAYGYRKFRNYRKRILLHFKLKPSVKQREQGNPILRLRNI